LLIAGINGLDKTENRSALVQLAQIANLRQQGFQS